MRTRLPQLLALATAGVLVLGGCSDPAPVSDDTSPTRGADRGETPSEQEPTQEPAETPGGDDGTGAGARTVPVYLIGDTERAGPRLYREFQRGEGDPLTAARTALTSPPLDPDYRTAWSATQLLTLSFDGVGPDGVVGATVDPSVRSRPAGMSRAEARAAVQQVVYTAQAALQERVPVGFYTDEGPIDRVFGVPTSEPLANAEALSVLSHVNLTSPEQGAVVTGDTLAVSGVGTSFEANLGWEVRQGTTVVDSGYATLEGWMEPRLFPFETSVDIAGLEPGDYTFWITTDDPTGGTEGVGAMTDDRAFTVE